MRLARPFCLLDTGIFFRFSPLPILDNVGTRRFTEEILDKSSVNIRMVAICFAAASVGLSMALISVAKLVLFIAAIFSLARLQGISLSKPQIKASYVPVCVLMMLAALTASLLWTTGPMSEALNSLGKYGKLLVIVILMAIIRTRKEACYAVVSLLVSQIILVLGSWALFLGAALPWATSNMALTQYSVFSSYLDQGIMSAVAAAILWHLRALLPGKPARMLTSLIAAVAMVNVLFVLQGRTGHLVAVALLSLAIMWELPRKMRLAVVMLPFVLVGFLYVASERVSNRLNEVVAEVQAFSPKDAVTTSSGIRLSLWLRATQMIAAEPLKGYGPGNWNTQYNNAQKAQNAQKQPVTTNFNTHQEYLQWGVQLGVPGILLFVGLMACIFRDGLSMSAPISRATLSVLAAFAVACLFNSSLYDAHIGDFFCVAFGLLLALGLQKNDRFSLNSVHAVGVDGATR